MAELTACLVFIGVLMGCGLGFGSGHGVVGFGSGMGSVMVGVKAEFCKPLDRQWPLTLPLPWDHKWMAIGGLSECQNHQRGTVRITSGWLKQDSANR